MSKLLHNNDASIEREKLQMGLVCICFSKYCVILTLIFISHNTYIQRKQTHFLLEVGVGVGDSSGGRLHGYCNSIFPERRNRYNSVHAEHSGHSIYAIMY